MLCYLDRLLNDILEAYGIVINIHLKAQIQEPDPVGMQLLRWLHSNL